MMKSRTLAVAVLIAVSAVVGYYATLAAAPYALMRAATHRIARDLPSNSFAFGQLSTPDNQPVVRPSPDLLYATCRLDLSRGPVTVTVEPIPDTYWSVSVFDARTDVAAVRSDRDTKGEAARLVLYREGTARPTHAGFDPVALSSDTGLVLMRILVTGPDHATQIDPLRRRSVCAPLSLPNAG